MAVHFVVNYVVALAGLAVGCVTGYFVALGIRTTSLWDTRTTLPLVLAAGAAHLALIPVVEQQRQVLFGLYFLGMAGVFAFAMLGFGVWRLGAILLPAGSIFAYFYFGLIAHQVDFVGLAVKAIEVAVSVAAIVGLVAGRGRAPATRRSPA